MRREVQLRFIRHQVHVRKDYDARDGLLGDLRAPAGFRPSVVAFTLGKPQLQQEHHQVHEVRAGAAEGVMVVVAPPEAEPVLALLLIATLPVGTLGFEEQLASQVASDQVQDPVEGLTGGSDAFRVAGKHSPSRPPQFPGLDNVPQFLAPERGGHESEVGPALDRLQLCPVFLGHCDAAIA